MTFDDASLRVDLLAGDATGLQRAFGWARRVLEGLDTEALLSAGPPPLAALAELVDPIEHVGFVAPPHGDHALITAAVASGFVASRTFASRILSRELGARLGRDAIPTRVFKAMGPPGAVEVFMPDVEPDVLRAWIGEGLGTHVALPLRDTRDFPRALALLADAGFERPPGLDDGPLGNADEQVLIAYADGAIAGRRLRLELCHETSRAPGRAR